MSGVKSSVLLCYIFVCVSFVSGHVKEGCFDLKYNLDEGYFDWSNQARKKDLELVCSKGFIHIQSVVSSIPKTKEQYCYSLLCPNNNGFKECDCCQKNKNGTHLCRISQNLTYAQVTACSGKKSCFFTGYMKDLSQECHTDYPCANETDVQAYKCDSRWIEVHYECIEAVGNTTTELSVHSTKVPTTLALTSLKTSHVSTSVHKSSEKLVSYSTRLPEVKKNTNKGNLGGKDEKLDRPDKIPVIEKTTTKLTVPSTKIPATFAVASLRTSHVSTSVHKSSEKQMTYSTTLPEIKRNAHDGDNGGKDENPNQIPAIETTNAEVPVPSTKIGTTLALTSLRTFDFTTNPLKTSEQNHYTSTPSQIIKDEMLDRPDQLLVIGVSIGVCLVTLISALVIAMCYVRYRKLHQRYKQQEELISGERNVEANRLGESGQDSQVQILGVGNQRVVKYANNDSSDIKAKMTNQNSISPDTADTQPAVYAQVQHDLKNKSRSKDIDGSNHSTNPELEETVDKDVTGGTDVVSSPDMVENVYYEGSAWA